jgi:hypothetical protein
MNRGYTTGQMLRKPSYWLFILWQGMLSLLGVCMVGQCAALITEAGGSVILATTAVTFSPSGTALEDCSTASSPTGWAPRDVGADPSVFTAGSVLVCFSTTGNCRSRWWRQCS